MLASSFLITFQAILPEVFIGISLSFLIVFGSFLSTTKKKRYPILILSSNWLSFLVLVLCSFLVINNNISFCSCFNGSLIFDFITVWVKFFLLVFSSFCILVSFRYLNSFGIYAFEYNLFILFAVIGIMLIVSSNDLVFIYISIELQSLSLYTIASFKRGSAFSTEAGLKYFILGAFSSGLLLFGSSLIYGLIGTTNFEDISRLLVLADSDTFFVYKGIVLGLAFLLFGLLFKLAAAPFHVWSPDVYEGSPTTVSTFFAVVPKVVLLAVLVKVLFIPFYDFLDFWYPLIVFSSVFSMFLSSFVAIYQRKLKRFIAYSSIGHVGYMIIGVSCVSLEGLQAVFIYVFIYTFMSLNLWTVILSLERKKKGLDLYISQLNGLSQTNLVLSLTFSISMFSAMGLPPLAGFLAKMYIFLAAFSSSLFILGFIGVFCSVVSAYYYLRFVKVLFFDQVKSVSNYNRICYQKSLVLGISFFIVLLFFLYPTFLLVISHNLSISILA